MLFRSRFVDDGLCPAIHVRKPVVESWKRSAEHRISFTRDQAPLLDEDELHLRRSRCADMIAVAAPVMQHFHLLLADSSSMLILTDDSGCVISAMGDQRVMDAGRDNHLEPGGDWTEQTIGTNAIGTALAEQAAAQIHGCEHYCEAIQRWSCAAVPVFNPVTRRLLGIVDISGLASSFNPQSTALAVAIGKGIEVAIERQLHLEHEVLLQQLLGNRTARPRGQVSVIDRYGQIVHPLDNSKIKTLLQESGMLEDAQAHAPDDWPHMLSRHAVNTDLELVRHEGSGIGALLFHGESKTRSLTRPSQKNAAADHGAPFANIRGDSPAMRAVKDRACQLAAAGLPVLIAGETGTGKELFARGIHALARGPQAPFVPVNCGGMAHELIASELFGYTGGAFTGASADGSKGKIVAADGGTLCLDEIGELPLELQPYLLRVLEDGIVYPVGAQEGRQVQVLLVSMTNCALQEEIAAGRFRSDLFYRIASATIAIPPLRERGDDAALLAEYYACEFARRMDRSAPHFTAQALDAFCRYDWPGNVRQLRNVVETVMALTAHDQITLDDLPPELLATSAVDDAEPGDLLQSVEKTAICDAIRKCNGNLTETAKLLGIARSTLYLRLRRYDITY